MIKKYKLEGKEFQSVIIPRGTVLFRGIRFENKYRYNDIFNDMIGYVTEKYYAIDPNMNVFFYPVPYASDTVNIYNIHIMYITQYDIELLLLIKPSTMTLYDKDTAEYNSVINTCNNISSKNKCGQDMSKTDLCFTDKMLKRFPQIDGYIAISYQDSTIFTQKIKTTFIKYSEFNKIKQMLPSVVSNATGNIGIPEIVIHPLRFRHDNCYLIGDRFYSPKRIVKYCVDNRALYNYFPLLYFTNNGTFTINDLRCDDIINNIAANARTYNNEAIPDLYENINRVFGAMLGKEGYVLNNIIYKAFVDKRTGFYKVYVDSTSKKHSKHDKRNTTCKSVKRKFKDDAFDGYLNTYIIKSTGDSRLNTIVSSYDNYMRDFVKDLGANGYSAKKALVFDRGSKESFAYKFYIDKVFDRPDLAEYKNIRRRKKNITNKRRNMQMAEFFAASGLDPDNISSINDDDYEILDTT